MYSEIVLKMRKVSKMKLLLLLIAFFSPSVEEATRTFCCIFIFNTNEQCCSTGRVYFSVPNTTRVVYF